MVGEDVLRDTGRALAEHGIAVFPFMPTGEAHLKALSDDFDAFLKDLPEYRDGYFSSAASIDSVSPSLIPYGSVVSASGFHAPLSRRLRRLADQAARPVFRSYVEHMTLDEPKRRPGPPVDPLPTVLIQQSFDRINQRGRDNVSASAGGDLPTTRALLWHRDASGKPEGGSRFGGWMNLSTTHSTPFTFEPGTHVGEEAAAAVGFHTAGVAAPKRSEYCTVRIPPGCMMVFRREMKHAVHPATFLGERRLFLGFYLVYDHGQARYDGRVEDWMENGGVPVLSTGRVFDSYPPNMTAATDSLLALSKHSVAAFKNEFLTTVSVGSGAGAGGAGAGAGGAGAGAGAASSKLKAKSTTPFRVPIVVKEFPSSASCLRDKWVEYEEEDRELMRLSEL